MAKIIVDRPRTGGGGGERPPKYEKNVVDPDEQLPSKEGIKKRHYRSRKELNENLAPLERFLHKQVGRPWDKIYSEIRENINPDSAVQKHVLDHLWQFVNKDVVIKNNHPFVIKYSRDYSPLRRGDLYVDPDSKLLCEVKKNFKYKNIQKAVEGMTIQEIELLERLMTKFVAVAPHTNFYTKEHAEFALLHIKQYKRKIL